MLPTFRFYSLGHVYWLWGEGSRLSLSLEPLTHSTDLGVQGARCRVKRGHSTDSRPMSPLLSSSTFCGGSWLVLLDSVWGLGSRGDELEGSAGVEVGKPPVCLPVCDSVHPALLALRELVSCLLLTVFAQWITGSRRPGRAALPGPGV